jgi:hypothetical protein
MQVAAIRERLPQAEWVLFEQSGHLSHAEEPDRYMAVLADFLARAEAGRVARRADVDPAAGLRPAASAGIGRLTGRPGPDPVAAT